MIVGALGSLMHVVRSFFWYVGNGELKNRWLLMYLLMPFNGAGLAALFYLIIRGSISPSAPTSPSSVDGHVAIAALVGLFSQQAMEKLKKIAESFFSAAPGGQNPAPPIPVIATAAAPAITPNVGAIGGGTQVKITGFGFVQGDSVKFDNFAATAVNVTSLTELTATAPAHSAGTVDVEVCDSAGKPKASLKKSFTYQ
jgi:hypothetical protein